MAWSGLKIPVSAVRLFGSSLNLTPSGPAYGCSNSFQTILSVPGHHKYFININVLLIAHRQADGEGYVPLTRYKVPSQYDFTSYQYFINLSAINMLQIIRDGGFYRALRHA
jgi:hypothetical protein